MADGVEVGRAHVAVTADAKAAVRSVANDFSRSLPAIGRKAGSGLGSALALGLKAGGLVTGVAGIVKGFGAAVGSAGNFEKSMRLVAVTSKAGQGELKSLTATAIEMGAKTSFSAQGASDAMVALAKGGLTAAQIQGGALQETLTLATAGGLELGSAANYMVSGLKAFGLQAEDSGRVAAALAGGANASTASVESMGLALSQTAAQAATAGLSIEDTAAGIAALANNGIQGSDAGTSLKVMLQRLVPQTDKAKGSMEELGLITKKDGNLFFDAQGNMKSLTDVAGLLQNALKNQTKEQKLNTLYRLFGSDATRAASILTKEGAAGLAEYTKATSDQNAAQNLAQNATQGFAGAMERFKGSLETVGIQLGTKLLPALTQLLNFLSGQAIPALTTFFGFFARHKDSVGAIAVGVGVFAAGIGGLILPMKIIALSTRAWAAAQVILNIALTANPIGLVIVAIGALVAGLIFAWKHSETFRNVVLSVWGAIKGAVLAVVNWLVVNVPAAWNKITTVVSNVVSVVATVLKKAFMLWTLPIRIVMTAILTIIALAWMAIRKPVLAAMTFIRDRIIIPVWNAIASRFRIGISTIQAMWTRFWFLLRLGASTIWNYVYNNIIAPVWNRIRAVWTSASTAVRNTWNSFWNAIKSVTTPAINFVHDKIRTVLDKIKNAFNTTKGNIKKIWDGIQDVVSKPIRWIVDHVYNAPLVPVWNRVAKLVSGPTLHAYAKGGTVHGPRRGRDNVLGIDSRGVPTAMVEPGEWVGPRWMASLFPWLEDIRRKGPQKFQNEGSPGLPGFAGGGVVGWLKGLVGSAGSTVSNLAGKIKDWVLGGLRAAAGKLLDPVKGLIDRAMPSSGVGKTVGGIGKKAIDLILDKIKKEDAAAMPAPGSPGGLRGSAIGTGGWASIYRALRAVGARNFTTYAGHDQGASRSRDITPPSQRIADTARRLSSIWYVIYNRRIASITHGMRWRPYTRYGPHASPSQAHTNHVHVTLKPGVKAALGGVVPDFAKYDRGGLLKPGWTMAYNGTGKDEQVVPRGGGTGGVNIYGGSFGYTPEEIAAGILREQRHKQALNPVFG